MAVHTPPGYGRRGTPWVWWERYTLGMYTHTTLVYTPPGYIYTPIPPWVYSLLLVHPAHACRYTLAGAVPDDEALGSTLGIIRGNEARRALQPPKVCKREGHSAQSCSALPVDKVDKIG